MEVLPTDWSPKKTSLYLASGARLLLTGRFAGGLLLAAADSAILMLLLSNTDCERQGKLLDQPCVGEGSRVDVGAKNPVTIEM